MNEKAVKKIGKWLVSVIMIAISVLYIVGQTHLVEIPELYMDIIKVLIPINLLLLSITVLRQQRRKSRA